MRGEKRLDRGFRFIDRGVVEILASSLTGLPLLRVPEHINLAWIASEAYILRKAMADLLEMHPNPNPIFQKNVKKDGYF